MEELHMIPYNTSMPPLVLHEYGRHIQDMVDYCVGIPDREERTQCAYAIADVMANLFPDLVGDKSDDGHKIWDHINIMSDFKLDIDFPCEVITREELMPRPERLPYQKAPIRRRLYGRNMEAVIKAVAAMENGPEKDALVSRVAHHMKKLMSLQNKDGVDNALVLRDLCDYSGGLINLDPATYPLQDFFESAPQQQQRFGKKKKKNASSGI